VEGHGGKARKNEVTGVNKGQRGWVGCLPKRRRILDRDFAIRNSRTHKEPVVDGVFVLIEPLCPPVAVWPPLHTHRLEPLLFIQVPAVGVGVNSVLQCGGVGVNRTFLEIRGKRDHRARGRLLEQAVPSRVRYSNSNGGTCWRGLRIHYRFGPGGRPARPESRIVGSS